ncbi:MAG: histidine kinase [Firmicutes bacterium]|nr:histidine kinase [Bacillota bacterium]
MHPILKSRARLGAYLLGWLPVALMLMVFALFNGWSWAGAALLTLPSTFLAALLFLSSWYLCRAFPLRSEAFQRQGLTLLVAALVMGVGWSGVVWSLAQTFVHNPTYAPEEVKPTFWAAFAITGVLLYLIVVALHYLLMSMEERQESERVEQELRVLAREAELKALRAQLNPHFLFNSLNSISALTSIDPKRAREMCVLLSDFLRKSLKLGERSSVRLAEEMDLARNYLAIEQIRFGSRLAVAWSVDPLVENAEVPTLLLQPLVENAIKHGIAQAPEGGEIRIQALPNGEFVEIHVGNPSDDDAAPTQGLGLGLRHVKQRLQSRYGPRVFFDAKAQNGQYEVILTFPRDAEELP